MYSAPSISSMYSGIIPFSCFCFSCFIPALSTTATYPPKSSVVLSVPQSSSSISMVVSITDITSVGSSFTKSRSYFFQIFIIIVFSSLFENKISQMKYFYLIQLYHGYNIYLKLVFTTLPFFFLEISYIFPVYFWILLIHEPLQYQIIQKIFNYLIYYIFIC